MVTLKKKLGSPVYNTVSVNNSGFFSTVTVNGIQFKSMSIYTKRKEAEQDAAQVALDAMECLPADNPMNSESTTKIKNSTISLKGRLQEYCQKFRKPLPEYTC